MAPAGDHLRRLPGEEGLWFFLAADVTLFAALFGSFSSTQAANAAAFAGARHLLMPPVAALNTIFLLTSSWLAATATVAMRSSRPRRAAACIAGATLLGVCFIGTKITEYVIEIGAGASLADNGFFMFYFVITGIHLLHVVGGTALLAVVWQRLRSSGGDHRDLLLLESGASFWHVVDILWLFIFPLFYLLP